MMLTACYTQRVERQRSHTPSRPLESCSPCLERVATASCRRAAAVDAGARRASVETGSGAAAATTPTTATGSPSVSSMREKRRKTTRDTRANWRACS